MRTARFTSLALLLGLAVVGTTACPGSLEDPQRFTEGSDCMLDIERDVFAARCGGSACHGMGTPAGAGLDLVSPDVTARLIGKPAVGCVGRVLVSTAAPDQSLLLEKLAPTVGCGLRMPLGADPLTDEERGCVRAWIVELAGSSTTTGGS